MDLIFRETEEADIDTLFDVRERTRENPATRQQLAAMGITPASTAAALKSGETKGWVCLDAGTIVGFSSADVIEGEVLVLAVLPQYEGKGIGKRLLSRAVSWLHSQGFNRVWLAASPDPGVRAHGFYRSQGWRPTGERQEHGDEILVLDAVKSS